MKAWQKILIFILLIVLSYCGLYLYSLSKIEVRGADFNKVHVVGLDGMTIEGYVEIYNGGLVTVKIDHIEYEVILEATGSNLSSGYVKSAVIPSGKSVRFPVANKINWVPSAELAANIITEENTHAKIKGIVYIADLKIMKFKDPFETRTDLEPYIKQFMMNKVQELVTGLKKLFE